MICESAYWKNELKRMAYCLSEIPKRKRWYESSLAILEKNIMIGCYAIRKLIESYKVTDRVRGMNVTVYIHKKKSNKTVDFLNTHKLDELYMEGWDGNIDLKFFLNQIIHSFIFCFTRDEKNNVSGLFFTSDKEKDINLYHIKISTILNVFNTVISDEVNFIKACRGCRLRIMFEDPSKAEKKKVNLLEEILIIHKNNIYEIGFRNKKTNKYEQKPIADEEAMELLNKYTQPSIVNKKEDRDKINELVTSYGGSIEGMKIKELK